MLVSTESCKSSIVIYFHEDADSSHSKILSSVASVDSFNWFKVAGSAIFNPEEVVANPLPADTEKVVPPKLIPVPAL